MTSARRGAVVAIGIACATAGCASTPAAGGPSAAAPRATIETTTFASALGISPAEATRLPSGVYYKDVVVGSGPTAGRDMQITFRYLAYLPDGKLVSGGANDPPVTARLNTTELIRGWYDAIPGMKEGGLRLMIVPPEMAYGNRARGAIPPNSILVFEVQLLRAR
jgi:FKBP-type peptidyl-prolyl cis-trans isomerase FkpA